MKMEVTVIVDGEEYILKGVATKVEHIQEDYMHQAKIITKAIANVEKPRTLTKITKEVREHNTMSMKLVRKVLDIYVGKLWESSIYRNPQGGKPTSQYKLIKKKDK